MRDNTICVSSFAKSYLCAGMKVGYVVAPPVIINALRHYYMLNSFIPNTAALLAGADILSGPQDFLAAWGAAKPDRLMLSPIFPCIDGKNPTHFRHNCFADGGDFPD